MFGHSTLNRDISIANIETYYTRDAKDHNLTTHQIQLLQAFVKHSKSNALFELFFVEGNHNFLTEAQSIEDNLNRNKYAIDIHNNYAPDNEEIAKLLITLEALHKAKASSNVKPSSPSVTTTPSTSPAQNHSTTPNITDEKKLLNKKNTTSTVVNPIKVSRVGIQKYIKNITDPITIRLLTEFISAIPDSKAVESKVFELFDLKIGDPQRFSDDIATSLAPQKPGNPLSDRALLTMAQTSLFTKAGTHEEAYQLGLYGELKGNRVTPNILTITELIETLKLLDDCKKQAQDLKNRYGFTTETTSTTINHNPNETKNNNPKTLASTESKTVDLANISHVGIETYINEMKELGFEFVVNLLREFLSSIAQNQLSQLFNIGDLNTIPESDRLLLKEQQSSFDAQTIIIRQQYQSGLYGPDNQNNILSLVSTLGNLSIFKERVQALILKAKRAEEKQSATSSNATEIKLSNHTAPTTYNRIPNPWADLSAQNPNKSKENSPGTTTTKEVKDDKHPNNSTPISNNPPSTNTSASLFQPPQNPKTISLLGIGQYISDAKAHDLNSEAQVLLIEFCQHVYKNTLDQFFNFGIGDLNVENRVINSYPVVGVMQAQSLLTADETHQKFLAGAYGQSNNARITANVHEIKGLISMLNDLAEAKVVAQTFKELVDARTLGL